jgi:hypothetical protein
MILLRWLDLRGEDAWLQFLIKTKLLSETLWNTYLSVALFR